MKTPMAKMNEENQLWRVSENSLASIKSTTLMNKTLSSLTMLQLYQLPVTYWTTKVSVPDKFHRFWGVKAEGVSYQLGVYMLANNWLFLNKLRKLTSQQCTPKPKRNPKWECPFEHQNRQILLEIKPTLLMYMFTTPNGKLSPWLNNMNNFSMCKL